MRPGIVLPEFLIEQLQATEEQRQALAKLQATVDAELAKILAKEQLEQLKQMGPGQPREGRGPEGRGPEGRRPESENGGREERPARPRD